MLKGRARSRLEFSPNRLHFMEINSFIKMTEDAVDGIAAGSLQGSTLLADIPQWDSLAVLIMLAQFDAEYGVQVSGSEMQQCRSMGDLFRTVQTKVEKKG
jgi:acyl carrier protein